MDATIKLTQLAEAGGCAAKLGPLALGELLRDLSLGESEDLLVGCGGSDDAAVYRLGHGQALIATVDFFPPVVDDPYSFGQVAAANALSDVWAMGGAPKLCLNLLCVPGCHLPQEAVRAILAGGADKVRQAGAVLAGGHSIQDHEPKYGLCVMGLAREEDILRNDGAREGDLLVLTKPLGTGALTTAARGGLLSESETAGVISVMTTLNKGAWEAMMPLKPHACTDVTGFGLVGHALEMARGSGLTLELWADKVPLQPRAEELAAMGVLPSGCHRNRADLAGEVEESEQVPLARRDLFFDPQTSGGLLIALPEREAEELTRRIPCAVIGRAAARQGKALRIL